jgi:predicted phosphodiesterase
LSKEKSGTLAKRLQTQQDALRVERKLFREEMRNVSVLETLADAMVDAIIQAGHTDFNTIKHKDHNPETEGIMQISDSHFNEIVELPFNQFDFPIGSKRMQKYVHVAKKMFHARGIKTVWVAFTGDMINSDRRLDEVMNAATNRTKASVLTAMIMKQVLLDMNKDFNLKVVMVTGNEARVHKEMGSSEITLSDNYDVMIHEMLRFMFLDKQGIEFLDGNLMEQVIEVMGNHILMVHGQQIKMSQVSSQMQRLKGKWSDYNLGKTINYVIFGHFHTARITDLFGRSGGLAGANGYSDNLLQLSSRASQNIYFVDKEGIDGLKIDLQNYEGFEGYNIDKMLEAYNPRSAQRVPWKVQKRI